MSGKLHFEARGSIILDHPINYDHILSESGKRIIYVSKRKSLHVLDLDPARLSVEKTDHGVELVPHADKPYKSLIIDTDEHADLVVIDAKEQPELLVYNVNTKEEKHILRRSYAQAITPDGKWWITLHRPFNDNEEWVYIQDTRSGERYTATSMFLDDPGNLMLSTRNFVLDTHPGVEADAKLYLSHKIDDPDYSNLLEQEIQKRKDRLKKTEELWTKPRALYLDNPDSLCIKKIDKKSFEIFVGCYGFIWSAVIEYKTFGKMKKLDHSSLIFSDVVYDPVEMVSPPGSNYSLAVHGYGSGLIALDSLNKCSYNFPARQLDPQHNYGSVSGGIAGIGTPTCLVRCGKAEYLWNPGSQPVEIIENIGYPIAIYKDVLLAQDLDGDKLTWYSWSRE